jgi:hypothetical protein
MNSSIAKISAIFLSLLTVLVTTNGWSATSLSGGAELSYTKYDASGKDIVSGNSFAQKYSISYAASNLNFKNQPRYYKLMVGYDLIDFSTKVTESNQETEIKQSFGRIKYSGEVGYNASGLPIRFKAYINNNQPLKLTSGLISTSLINDDLAHGISGHGTSISSGVSMAFEPENSYNSSLRALPKFFLEYRDTTQKSSEGFYRIDSRTKELAVAGNKENNWVNYRSMNSENYLQPLDNSSQQQLQIGLVDNRGRRKWSALTNWIDVSADAQFTEVKGFSTAFNLEEYDINFMAIAKRRQWDARTFMNYNRQMKDDALTENARVPLYVKGIYGSDTDWYVSMAASRGRENSFLAQSSETSSTNSISVGGTTFNRSKFTLSSSLNLLTSKSFGGFDSYSVDANLETVSTRRFSDKLGLGSKLTFRTMDDGSDSATSKTWSSKLDLTVTYRPNSNYAYKIQDTIDSGGGAGFIDLNRLESSRSNVRNYLRNYILASAGWTPNARFATSLAGAYDVIKATDLPENSELSVTYRATYDIKEVSYSVDSKYAHKDDGIGVNREYWNSRAQTQYRPDRNNDALLRFTHETEKDAYTANTRVELVQRYSYKFFSRKGEIRNIATLIEEYSFSRSNDSVTSGHSQYLMISGRYSPTDRYSLYGSAKYQKSGPPDSVTMYYNTGLSTDFRLLSASIDYTLAKKDVDNRIEKKLSASVRRSF